MFKNQQSLKRHCRDVHGTDINLVPTAIKRYPCPHPVCKRKLFKRKHHLHAHLKAIHKAEAYHPMDQEFGTSTAYMNCQLALSNMGDDEGTSPWSAGIHTDAANQNEKALGDGIGSLFDFASIAEHVDNFPFNDEFEMPGAAEDTDVLDEEFEGYTKKQMICEIAMMYAEKDRLESEIRNLELRLSKKMKH